MLYLFYLTHFKFIDKLVKFHLSIVWHLKKKTFIFSFILLSFCWFRYITIQLFNYILVIVVAVNYCDYKIVTLLHYCWWCCVVKEKRIKISEFEICKEWHRVGLRTTSCICLSMSLQTKSCSPLMTQKKDKTIFSTYHNHLLIFILKISSQSCNRN